MKILIDDKILFDTEEAKQIASKKASDGKYGGQYEELYQTLSKTFVLVTMYVVGPPSAKLLSSDEARQWLESNRFFGEREDLFGPFEKLT